MAQPVRVLAIDGGGIRGIIPAIILAEIEKRTGQPIARMFDLIAGTSTGGILALGLTKPGEGAPALTARDLVRLYEEEGPAIFARSPWYSIHAAGNIINEKYPSSGIESVLERYFGEARLSEALADVLITSYEIEQRFPFFFKSYKARRDPAFDFPMKQVARATSAAPTYFEPLKLPTTDLSDYYALVDGGVFANNPAMCAYVEARTMFPEQSSYLVVSLGTGQQTRRLPYEQAKDWGLIEWAQPILDVVFDGVSDTVDYQLRQLLPPRADGGRSYYRFQTRLGEQNDRMDNIRLENLRELKLLAEEMIRACNDDINQLCQDLTGIEVDRSLTLSPQEDRQPVGTSAR